MADWQPLILNANAMTTVLVVLLLICALLAAFLMVMILRYRKWLSQIGASATQLAKGDFSNSRRRTKTKIKVH